ncbi:MAG: IPT/TIG domain-containing protein [Polyangiaceae bacterium]
MLRFTRARLGRLRVLAAVVVGAGGAVAGMVAAPSCIASGPDLSQITGHEDAGFSSGGGDAAPPDAFGDVTPTDPHAVIGAQPSHGAFVGGQRVLVRGNGFGPDVRVWFGDAEAEVVPVDATKVQVTAPAGTAGPVDLTTQNGEDASTKRTLTGGYTYDAIYADPKSGPISGGNEVKLVGQNTKWSATTTAFIDQVACAGLTVTSPTELVCVAPKGTPGSKTVRVAEGAEVINVLDGYTYEDSSDGYKGGLSGSALAGHLKVLVYDNYKGNPIPGAAVIVGTDETALVEQADASGVAVFTDASLDAPRTVTVAATCMNPITFVDVPVDTVTVYLDPVLSPVCGGSGDPPGTGTKVASSGGITGQIVFPDGVEFKRADWKVPEPVGNEAMVAYVFAASSSPTGTFFLPSPSAATTRESPGSVGYGFTFYASPGDKTLYALAGLEDRSKSPPTFVPYAMGLVRGVPVLPNEYTEDVFIYMDSTMDQALVLDPDPPGVGPKGPDRLFGNVAVRLGAEGFAILPNAQKTPFLPLQGDVEFVGVPALSGALTGSTYFVSARAVTGQSLGAPMSVVQSVQTNTTAFPLAMGGFVGVPTLTTPALNAAWDARHLGVQFGAGSSPIDLLVYDVSSGNGLQHWTIAVPSSAAPGNASAIELPDLSGIQGGALASGPITIGVYGARIDGFDYASLRYKHLRPGGMTAYALDYFASHLP